MNLEKFKLNTNVFHPILAVSFINFILMVVLLIISTTIFAKPSGVQMEFPLFKEGIYSSDQGVVITVTSENVIYVNGHVMTLNELRRFLANGNFYRQTLMIKADPRASMGRVGDILDLCRGISGASVNVSTIF